MTAAIEFRFPFGDVVTTPGADALLREHNVAPVRLLARHLSGDWGQVSADDAQANEAAVENGNRINASDKPLFWNFDGTEIVPSLAEVRVLPDDGVWGYWSQRARMRSVARTVDGDVPQSG